MIFFLFSKIHHWFYKKVPGQEAIVRVILPLSSLSVFAKQACIMPDVLLPLTARRMSPHLKEKQDRGQNTLWLKLLIVDSGGPSVCLPLFVHFNSNEIFPFFT